MAVTKAKDTRRGEIAKKGQEADAAKSDNGANLPATAHVSHPPALHHEELSVDDLIERVRKIQEIQERVMRPGVHYGVIPGCDKPTLLKAGAELLCLTFKLDPEFEHEFIPEGEHITVHSSCTLYHIPTGARVASGHSFCSTKEEKYAYRTASRTCPKCGKAAIIKGKAEFGGGWLCWTKRDGCGAKFPDGDRSIETQPSGKVPNDRLADCYNTVLKMADIRALRAATLFGTAASDRFTQDMEEVEPAIEGPPSADKPDSQPSPQGNPPPPPAKPGYAFTKSHQELKNLIAAYIKENEYTPDYEAKILIRLTTWVDGQGVNHPGVGEWDKVTEKMAFFAIKKFKERLKEIAEAKKKAASEQSAQQPAARG